MYNLQVKMTMWGASIVEVV